MTVIVAIVIGVAFLGFIAVILSLIGAGRATMRDISRQLRVVSPPKDTADRDEAPAHAAGAGEAS